MPSLSEFARLLGVPMHVLQAVLDALERRELVVQSTNDPPVYLPARDPSLISVSTVLETVRASGEERFLSPTALPAPQPVDAVLEQMRQAAAASVGDMTLRELAAQGSEPAVRA
jgi:membrane protein